MCSNKLRSGYYNYVRLLVLLSSYLKEGSSFIVHNYKSIGISSCSENDSMHGINRISIQRIHGRNHNNRISLDVTTTNDIMTPQFSSPYPTERGSEVDSRKIVAVNRQHFTAIRMKHILLATQEMADLCILQIRASETNFADLATQLSICTTTRNDGGEIGWINLKQQKQNDNNKKHEQQQEQQSDIDAFDRQSYENPKNDIDKNEHLNDIIPKDARDLVLQITTKPGDVCTVQSYLGYHVVQIVDVMIDVRQMVIKRQRKIRDNNKDKTITSNNSYDDDNNNNWLDTAHQLTYKMETMGCQMNVADSERIEGQLQSLGIKPYNDEENNNKKSSTKHMKEHNRPDIVIFNTCSIRDHAEQKVYSYIGPYAKRKRDGDNDITIIVAGCVAQQEGIQLLHRVPEIDLVMGPQYANRISDLLEYVRDGGNQIVATDVTHIMEDSTKPRRQSTISAWVNVIYGCNERCTFCIVPTTRGIEQSRPIESIINEVSDLVHNHGYKEITLLGQNIDAYGRDMIPKRKFSDLLRAVGTINGLERLRFVTSHPRYMSMGVIDAVADTKSICESFHIPFQSGSNTILETMGRGYTHEKYLRIVDRIRTKIPHAAITADVIVGFPGETEDDFQQTLLLMNEVIFDSVNTAAYSPRPNTPAATWTNQIDDNIKQDRLQRINILNKQHAKQRRERMLHRIVDVLIEEPNIQNPNQVMGRTRHGYIVYVDGNINELRGHTVNVQIHQTEMYYLVGTIVESLSAVPTSP